MAEHQQEGTVARPVSSLEEDKMTEKAHNVGRSLQKCGQLLVAFLLMASVPARFFPTSNHSNDAADYRSSSLRVQAIPPLQRRLQESQPNTAISQFDIIVPVFERDANLRDFAKRLKPSLEEYAQLTANNQTRIQTFRLLTTRYGEREQTIATKFQQELAQLTGIPTSQVVMVHAPAGASFDRAHAVNMMMAAACQEPHCLVARIDVDMDVQASFFVNSERDVVAGKTAYFPIVWSAFHPMSPELVQFHMDVQMMLKNQPRMTLMPYSPHRGHWRDYGTGMWTIGGPDAKIFRFNEEFKGWGGEDGAFYNTIKDQRKIVRYREFGLVHLWHPKYCTKGVTVFTDTQINECNWSRDGEKGSDIGRRMLDKWVTQNEPIPVKEKPIWQA